MKEKAKSAGLWNLFIPKEIDPDVTMGRGLTNLEYAFMAEEMGKCIIASEALNCRKGESFDFVNFNSQYLFQESIKNFPKVRQIREIWKS